MNTPDLQDLSMSATPPGEAIVGEMRQGIDRAFDVIRNHTVHTKGYVVIALKFIDEFGEPQDKVQLSELLRSKSSELAAGTGEAPPKGRPRKK